MPRIHPNSRVNSADIDGWVRARGNAARSLDPATGEFTSMDPVSGPGANNRSRAAWNPVLVEGMNPTGLETLPINGGLLVKNQNGGYVYVPEHPRPKANVGDGLPPDTLQKIVSILSLEGLLESPTFWDAIGAALSGLDIWDEFVQAGHSADPNSMLGPGGFGAENFVSDNATLPYQIDFENSPSATAPARSVDDDGINSAAI